jgi:hypothetical protein
MLTLNPLVELLDGEEFSPSWRCWSKLRWAQGRNSSDVFLSRHGPQGDKWIS